MSANRGSPARREERETEVRKPFLFSGIFGTTFGPPVVRHFPAPIQGQYTWKTSNPFPVIFFGSQGRQDANFSLNLEKS